MADLKISQLTASTTPLAGTEVLPIVQSGTTKRVSVANLTAGRSVSASEVKVGGTTSADVLKVLGRTSDGYSLVVFMDSTGVTNRAYLGSPAANELALFDGSFNERLRMTSAGDIKATTGNFVVGTSGKGIDFSATSGAGTSELLSDYEEGTWTPALNGSTPGTVTATVSGTYTKIGRTVFCTFSIVQTSAGAGTGDTIISGLPYAISSQGAGSLGSVQNLKANVVRIQPYGSSGSSFYLFGMAAAAASDTAALAYNTYIQNNTQLYGTFSYITA